MTGSAEGEITSAAKEHRHGTASHAFPVNELVSVFLAEIFTVAKFLHSTFFANEFLRQKIIGIF